MSTIKTIAYVGNFSFPYGNASGSRVLANGCLLRSLGYNVIFIGLDDSLKQNSSLKETKKEFENFTYYNLPYPSGVGGWLAYKQRFNEVLEILVDYELYSVISYGSPTISLFGKLLKKWCNNKKVFFLADVVDWMGAGVGSFAYRTIKFIDSTYQKRILNSQTDGVIAISTYLSDFYSKMGNSTVVIPPLVNFKRFEKLDFDFNVSSPTQLIYVGRPFLTDGRKVKKSSYKDRLDIVIEALYSVKHLNYIFNIYGLQKHEYLSVIIKHKDILKQLEHKIVFHGIINNVEGIKEIAKADFTILFRNVNKMTTAGFPTKFSETLSCGTPIITTKTSDLEYYLKEGKNGFFIDMNDSRLLEDKLSEILSLSKSEILEMKEHCRQSKYFDYSNYQDKMSAFLQSLTL